jgi:thioesterase domain-containing protein
MNQHSYPHLQQGTGDVVAEFPCSQSQLLWWILDSINPGDPAYNVAVCWEIRGRFSAASIEAAFERVIVRHEVLRTRFVEHNDAPVQQVMRSAPFKLSIIDLRGVSEEKRSERVTSIGEMMAREPFDLTRPCLIRAALLLVEADRGILMTTAHHIVFDGWSIRVLGREIGEIASAIDARRVPALPDLPLQYGDYALWQQDHLESCGFETEKSYWFEHIGGQPYFEVEPDFPRGPVKTSTGGMVAVAKPSAFSEKMAHAAAQLNVTQYALGAAVVALLLGHETGKENVVVGSQVSGRYDEELEPLIGVFINNLVLRFDVDQNASFRDHVASVAASVAGALEHRNMPFNRLVELLNPVRDATRNPLISVNFNLQKAFMEDRAYGAFELVSRPSLSPGAIFDLNFFMVGRPDGWRLALEYNSDLFSRERAERLLSNWEAIYDRVLTNLDVALRDIAYPHSQAAPGNVPLGNAEGSVPQEEDTAKSLGLDAGHLLEKVTLPATKSDDPATPIPPDAALQAAIAQIWQDVLGAVTLSPADDFFRLGGHSLLALRMISRVRSELGLTPNLALLFQAPTLAAFTAGCVSLPTASTSHPAVYNPWQRITFRTGAKADIYTINHPFLYYRLAGELPEPVGVHNINLFGTEIDDKLRGLSFSELTDLAIARIEESASGGPVVLFGLCVNGNMAVEISHRLRARGYDVPFTGIIDSWSTDAHQFVSESLAKRMRLARRLKRAAYFAGKVSAGRMQPIAFMKQFNATKRVMTLAGIKAGEDTQEEFQNGEITRLLMDAAQGIERAPVLDATMRIFYSQSTHKAARDLTFGWIYRQGERQPQIALKGWHEDSLTSDGIRDVAYEVMRSLFGSD